MARPVARPVEHPAARTGLRIFLRSGVNRLRHPTQLHGQLLVTAWLAAVAGDVTTTFVGMRSGLAEGDGPVAAAMGVAGSSVFLAAVLAVGAAAAVLAAGRAVTAWQRVLLAAIGCLAAGKLAVVAWTVHALLAAR